MWTISEVLPQASLERARVAASPQNCQVFKKNITSSTNIKENSAVWQHQHQFTPHIRQNVWFFPRAIVGCSPDCKIHSRKPALLAGSKHSGRLLGQSNNINFFLDKRRFFRSKTQYSALLGLLLGPFLSLFGLKNEDQRLGRLRTNSKLLTGSRRDFATSSCILQSLNDCI